MCQWLWLGSQQPSAEFNCSLPPGPGPVSTAQILCQQSLFVECGLGIRRYVAAGAPPNITTLGFMPSNSNMRTGELALFNRGKPSLMENGAIIK